MPSIGALAEDFGVEYPIFAFSHCRDVVAEASRRGGFGVLGAGSYAVDELEQALNWIDENCGGKPYGVDLVIPRKSADTGTKDLRDLANELGARLPEEHRRFVRKILTENGIETRPIDAPFQNTTSLATTEASWRPLLEISLRHPLVRFVVSALGTPPAEVIDQIHQAGIKVGALAGSRRHAERHVADGVDVVIAQGTEAGGHAGEITTMVLVPDVVDAVEPVPVLAAGGIGTGRQIAAAMALGAQGVWTGSLWLTVAEAATPPQAMQDMFAASSSDTVRSTCLSGKPIRQVRSIYTDAWSRPDAPPTLEMPLQGLLLSDALPNGEDILGIRAGGLAKPIVGQIVGRLNAVRSTRAVMEELVDELLDTLGRLGQVVDDTTAEAAAQATNISISTRG
ncbi:nitronate monooxygenase [Mycobacterium sp. NAZ190054]|uniref:nitronate monooxygenase n=1 Tax=Mycobacterium sp. NAZ190054 TaxID=1747766 RepID=UPI000794D30B|nr:nitronate monooxygenase [Mycobacterium sp. NAZ190054]KWX69277.1 hypothetical protein ASJ79_00315 [Mycobacterium sp. NAZ190054]